MLAQRATVLACGPSALSECCATKRTSSPNRELFERAVHDAVAMEIDLAAIGAQNEAAILRGQEPRDPPVVGHRVQLDVAASLANVIFEQPASGVECVADRDIDILMRMVLLGIAPDHDLAPRNLRSTRTRNRLPCWRRGCRHSTTTRHDKIRSKKRSSSSERSRIRAATASDESIWRKVI